MRSSLKPLAITRADARFRPAEQSRSVAWPIRRSPPPERGTHPKEGVMEKIAKLQAEFRDSDHLGVIGILRATFSVFGSLTEGVDGLKLARALVAWADDRPFANPSLAAKVIHHLSTATTEQFAKVEFGMYEATLITPTSGTRIRVWRGAGGYIVEIDFGSEGSAVRAEEILRRDIRTGAKLGGKFGAQFVGGEFVREAARGYLDKWIMESAG